MEINEITSEKFIRSEQLREGLSILQHYLKNLHMTSFIWLERGIWLIEESQEVKQHTAREFKNLEGRFHKRGFKTRLYDRKGSLTA